MIASRCLKYHGLFSTNMQSKVAKRFQLTKRHETPNDFRLRFEVFALLLLVVSSGGVSGFLHPDPPGARDRRALCRPGPKWDTPNGTRGKPPTAVDGLNSLKTQISP